MGFRSWPGALLCLLPGGLGCWFFLNSDRLGTSYEGLGANLIGASAVALAVFLVETKRDRSFAEFAHQHAFTMQVALSRDLSGADLRGQDLTGLSFRNKNLRGANLAGAVLVGVDLSFADLSGANLQRADLLGAKLDSADLRLADFSYAKMAHSSLILADCRGTAFIGADMVGVSGLGANLSVLPAEDVLGLQAAIGREGAHWRRMPIPMPNSEAGRPATVTGASLLGSQWTGANFTGADLSKGDFRYSILGTDIFREQHPGRWRFLWWTVRKDARWRAVGSTRTAIASGHGVERVPAIFTDADTTDARFEDSVGPDLEFTEKQLASCKFPVDPKELRGLQHSPEYSDGTT